MNHKTAELDSELDETRALATLIVQDADSIHECRLTFGITGKTGTRSCVQFITITNTKNWINKNLKSYHVFGHGKYFAFILFVHISWPASIADNTYIFKSPFTGCIWIRSRTIDFLIGDINVLDQSSIALSASSAFSHVSYMIFNSLYFNTSFSSPSSIFI